MTKWTLLLGEIERGRIVDVINVMGARTDVKLACSGLRGSGEISIRKGQVESWRIMGASWPWMGQGEANLLSARA